MLLKLAKGIGWCVTSCDMVGIVDPMVICETHNIIEHS